MRQIRLNEVCVSATQCRRVPPGPNVRLHWAVRAKWNRAWKDAAFWEVVRNYPHVEPYERAIITLQIHAVRLPDWDNAIACMKPVVDGLKGLLITDDSPAHCEIGLRLVNVKHKKEEHVEVVVTQV